MKNGNITLVNELLKLQEICGKDNTTFSKNHKLILDFKDVNDSNCSMSLVKKVFNTYNIDKSNLENIEFKNCSAKAKFLIQLYLA